MPLTEKRIRLEQLQNPTESKIPRTIRQLLEDYERRPVLAFADSRALHRNAKLGIEPLLLEDIPEESRKDTLREAATIGWQISDDGSFVLGDQRLCSQLLAEADYHRDQERILRARMGGIEAATKIIGDYNSDLTSHAKAHGGVVEIDEQHTKIPTPEEHAVPPASMKEIILNAQRGR